ncbi:MAG: hypothetical protein PHN52_00350 [candidate division Zixibacteria bacterium]|nr:hypothetical protein [candidate division Zixibacteria bacterium]
MELSFHKIYSDCSYLFLPGLVAVSFSFTSAGLRHIRQKGYEGIVYFILALFFMVAHACFIFEIPCRFFPVSALTGISLGKWTDLILVPALLFTYILSGIYAFIRTSFNEGLIKIFFGLTLYCYLFMLGINWPENFRIGLVFIWFLFFIIIEIRTAGKKSGRSSPLNIQSVQFRRFRYHRGANGIAPDIDRSTTSV